MNIKMPLLLLVLLGTVLAGHAQETLRFHQQASWEAVLAEAKAQNRLVFVDAYTTWCGPCKMMDSRTFPDPRVAAFFGANFVNAKFDMEKGEGAILARRYEVVAYPTLLFINANGEVVHRGLGFHDADQLLALGGTALDPNLNLLGLEKQ